MLLVNDNWECKVGGFGIHRMVKGAKRGGSGFTSSSADEKKNLLAPWTAPELLSDNESENNNNVENQSRRTDKSDIYAFGVIIWEVQTTKKNKRPKKKINFFSLLVFNKERCIQV